MYNIRPIDRKAYEETIARFDDIAKPVGGMGDFEPLLARVAAAQGSADIDISRRCVLVYCADNGVVKQGTTPGGHEVTTAVAGLLVRGKASVAAMAAACNVDVFGVDMGMIDDMPGLRDRKIRRGTDDISEGPAMTREEAQKAIQAGIDCAWEAGEQGYRIIAVGETGIGNTTSSSALAAAFLGRPARDVTGRGAGLDDTMLQHKIEVIDRALARNAPDISDPLDVLAKLGGFDIAAMVGTFIGGGIIGLPVIMDGFIASVAALTAVKIDARVRDYIIPSHMSEEPGMAHVAEALGLRPVLSANMHLGEGTGAVMLLPLLDTALAVYRHAAHFSDISADEYRKK